MTKIKYLLLTIILFSTIHFAQTITIPKIGLTGVPFEVSVNTIPDSIKNIELVFLGGTRAYSQNLKVINGKVVTKIKIDYSRKYEVRTNLFPNTSIYIRVIPGWLSMLPPLLAIVLALMFRQVIVALSLGIFVGALIYYDFDPLIALLRFADTLMLGALIDKDHMFIILFTLLIGGVVGVISANGGTVGLAKQITKLAKTPKSGMVASWLLGIMMFFDDYANSLIIGNMMRPITDKLKISREKLAYIVDSTAAPIASIVIISTWVGYEVGLIADGLESIGSTQNAYDVFISSIPYSFYPIATLFFVFIISYMEYDFGAMLRVEKRARASKVITGHVETDEVELKTKAKVDKSNSKWFNGAVPILVILLGTIIGLVITGMNGLDTKGITEYTLQNIINHADSFSSLLWASFIASIVAVVMSVAQRLLSLNEAMEAWQKGIQSMMVAVIILIFAWAISSVANNLKTADYIISLLSDSLNPRFLPAIIFILCAVVGFSTGTSWGTMAIVMPIAIPLSFSISSVYGLDSASMQIVMYGVISSVLAGSVFGDHCSPIADTTILSSLATKCNHISHVKTQLPYAILVGVVSIALGSIPAAYGVSPFISIAMIFVALTLILKIYGKRVK